MRKLIAPLVLMLRPPDMNIIRAIEASRNHPHVVILHEPLPPPELTFEFKACLHHDLLMPVTKKERPWEARHKSRHARRK